MSHRFVAVALLLLLGTASPMLAAEGVPSASKLSALGLPSLSVVSDAQGMQVRGAGVGILGARFFSLTGGSIADIRGGMNTGPASPTTGTLGTITNNINVPVTTIFSQNGPGYNFQLTGSVWGQVRGFAN